MRPSIAMTVLAGALLVAPAARAERQRGNESWGQPGVSFLQYRTDAVECAYAVGQQAPVEYPLVDLVFADNMPSPDPNDPVASMQAVIDAEKARFSRPWREISAQLQEPLARCLSNRGYSRFRLTRDQTGKLRSLPPGSRARQVYLWNLAVDPQIQQRQVVRR
jgi:hypothetical protein